MEASTSFTALDYIVIAILTLSTIFAFARGFIGSFLSLVGWAASIYLAYALYPQIKPYLDEKFSNHLLVLVSGHTVLLIGFLVLFGVFNMFATTAVTSMTKGIIDRSLGAAFGFVRGAMIVSFVYFIFITTLATFQGAESLDDQEKNAPNWVKKAKTYTMLKSGKEAVNNFIPDSFYKRMQEAYEDVSKKGLDERFVQNSIKKLSEKISKDKLNTINAGLEDDALTMSEEQLERKKLKEMYRAYMSEHQDSTAEIAFSDQEMARIKKIISTPEKAVKKNVDGDTGIVE